MDIAFLYVYILDLTYFRTDICITDPIHEWVVYSRACRQYQSSKSYNYMNRLFLIFSGHRDYIEMKAQNIFPRHACGISALKLQVWPRMNLFM